MGGFSNSARPETMTVKETEGIRSHSKLTTPDISLPTASTEVDEIDLDFFTSTPSSSMSTTPPVENNVQNPNTPFTQGTIMPIQGENSSETGKGTNNDLTQLYATTFAGEGQDQNKKSQDFSKGISNTMSSGNHSNVPPQTPSTNTVSGMAMPTGGGVVPTTSIAPPTSNLSPMDHLSSPGQGNGTNDSSEFNEIVNVINGIKVKTTHTRAATPEGNSYISTIDTEIERKELTTQEFINLFFTLTDEEKKNFEEKLTSEEMKQLLNSVEEHYQSIMNDLDNSILLTKKNVVVLNELLDSVSQYKEQYDIKKGFYQSDIVGAYASEKYDYLKEKYGVTDDDINKGMQTILERAMSSPVVASDLSAIQEKLNNQLQVEFNSDAKYQGYEGMTYQNVMEKKGTLETSINILETVKQEKQEEYETTKKEIYIYEKDWSVSHLENEDSNHS